MSSDWWARKLAAASAPPASVPGYPGTPVPFVPSYPGGPASAPPVPPVPRPNQPQVTKDNIAEVAGLWKGGEATRTQVERCPNCGGDHYFNMTASASQGGAGARIATERGMASSSPRCFDCGWNSHHGLQTGNM